MVKISYIWKIYHWPSAREIYFQRKPSLARIRETITKIIGPYDSHCYELTRQRVY
jgi:hypothetical protein